MVKWLIFAVPFVFILLSPVKRAIGPDPNCTASACPQRYEVKPLILSNQAWAGKKTYALPEERSFNQKSRYISGALLAGSCIYLYFHPFKKKS
jgi:hypothetical protein